MLPVASVAASTRSVVWNVSSDDTQMSKPASISVKAALSIGSNDRSGTHDVRSDDSPPRVRSTSVTIRLDAPTFATS